MTFDLFIKDGTLVMPGTGLLKADIGIIAGKIQAILLPGFDPDSRQTIHADGLHIFPGAIEPHSHLELGNGLEDYETETRSAAIGGITTILTFLRQPEDYLKTFHPLKMEAEKRAHIDFGFHAVLMSEQHLLNIETYYKELGITSFKFYLTYRGADAQFMGIEGIDDGFMFDCFNSVANLPNGLVILHAENIEIVNRYKNRLRAQGREDLKAWVESRPDFAETEAVRRAMYFAEVTNCRIHFLHLTSRQSLKEITTFKNRYAAISVEACHPYLHFTENDMTTLDMKVKPPFRTQTDIDALWEGIKGEQVNSIGSDHVPRSSKTKQEGTWSLVTGVPGTGLLFPVMLHEGYHQRKIPLHRIAEVTSANTARIYHLYPNKGSLQPGADADLTLVDINKEKVVTASDLGSVADYCPYEGKVLKGWPEKVISRGEIVAENGQLRSRKGRGRYLAR
jgi:dihydropyrimidinase